MPVDVLLVEDNDGDALLIEVLLEDTKCGPKVTRATDGEEAIRLIGERMSPGGKPFNLVLLDLKIPKKSGLEVLKFIRETSDMRVKVVVLTGSQHPEDRQIANELKADLYLIKPMIAQEMDELTATLRNVLLDEESC